MYKVDKFITKEEVISCIRKACNDKIAACKNNNDEKESITADNIKTTLIKIDTIVECYKIITRRINDL